MLMTLVWLGKNGNGMLYPVSWPGYHPLVIEKHMLCQSWDTQTNGPSLGHLDSRLEGRHVMGEGGCWDRSVCRHELYWVWNGNLARRRVKPDDNMVKSELGLKIS